MMAVNPRPNEHRHPEPLCPPHGLQNAGSPGPHHSPTQDAQLSSLCSPVTCERTIRTSGFPSRRNETQTGISGASFIQYKDVGELGDPQLPLKGLGWRGDIVSIPGGTCGGVQCGLCAPQRRGLPGEEPGENFAPQRCPLDAQYGVQSFE